MIKTKGRLLYLEFPRNNKRNLEDEIRGRDRRLKYRNPVNYLRAYVSITTAVLIKWTSQNRSKVGTFTFTGTHPF